MAAHSTLPSGPNRPARRLRDAAVLAVLAPFVAEVVTSSNTPAIQFPVVGILLVLIYGLPALLIRELWMRRWIGWPGFVVLGVSYTALNEGVIAATWFKLTPEHDKVLVFTAEQAGRSVGGLNGTLALNLSVYHTIWSMLIPIVLMEAWSTRGRGRPWLSGRAMSGCALLVGFVVVGSLSDKATARVCAARLRAVSDECASGRRGAAVFLVVGIVVALLLPRLRSAPGPGAGRSAPGPGAGRSGRPPDAALAWLGAGFSIAFLVSYFILPLSGHAEASKVMAVVLFVVAVAAVVTWSRSRSWDLHAAVMLVVGAMIPGMLSSIKAFLVLQPVAVALFVWFFLRVAVRRSRQPAELSSGDAG